MLNAAKHDRIFAFDPTDSDLSPPLTPTIPASTGSYPSAKIARKNRLFHKSNLS
jgi:hypothetical protein